MTTLAECQSWYGEVNGRAIWEYWEKVLADIRAKPRTPFVPHPPHWHVWLERYLEAAPNGAFADEANRLIAEYQPNPPSSDKS